METVNIRVYKSTYLRLKKEAEKQRRAIIVVLDELLNEKTNIKNP